MSYQAWRKDHPDWPARMKDLVGRKVVLTEKVETWGGCRFKAGETLQVYGIYRGRLHVEKLRPDLRYLGGIRHLSLRHVKLVVLSTGGIMK